MRGCLPFGAFVETSDCGLRNIVPRNLPSRLVMPLRLMQVMSAESEKSSAMVNVPQRSSLTLSLPCFARMSLIMRTTGPSNLPKKREGEILRSLQACFGHSSNLKCRGSCYAKESSRKLTRDALTVVQVEFNKGQANQR